MDDAGRTPRFEGADAMRYSLWCNGELIGHTTPSPGEHASGVISAFFHPSTAFATVGRPLLELADALMSLGPGVAADMPAPATLEGLTGEDRGMRIHEALRASPRAQRLAQLETAVASLDLELRDERGQVVPVVRVRVWRFPFPAPMLDAIRASVVKYGVEFSDLTLLAERPADGVP